MQHPFCWSSVGNERNSYKEGTPVARECPPMSYESVTGPAVSIGCPKLNRSSRFYQYMTFAVRTVPSLKRYMITFTPWNGVSLTLPATLTYFTSTISP